MLYKPCLNDINLNIKPGQLVLVVGSVGCGKSSLLMGILREINIVSGTVAVKGSISYASEDP